MTSVMSSCSPIPRSFHKPECTQWCASCTCVHRRVLQSVRHLIIRSFSGAGACAWVSAKTTHHTPATATQSEEVHQEIPSILGLAGSPAYYDILLLLVIVVGSVDERELHLLRSSLGTVDVGWSPGCQSMFRCI